MFAFPLKPALVMLTFLGLLAAVNRYSPDLRGLNRATINAVMEFAPEHGVAVEGANSPVLAGAKLEDPAGNLDHFYEALQRTERGEAVAVTRIVHYGDSPTTADLISGDVRAMMQQRFGDAGHGFTLPAKPWAWYEHRDVGLRGAGWEVYPASQADSRDGMFGLGGVSLECKGDCSSRIALKNPNHTQVEVWFLEQPGGGTFTVLAEGVPIGSATTNASTKAAGFARFTLPAGTRVVELQGKGKVRMFGVALDRPGPGVSYDSLGLNGAHVALLSHVFDEKHWAMELQHRSPDLLILNYGTNESGFTSFVSGTYERDLREVVRRLRRALPHTSLLLMSPMDRAERRDGEITTLATIPKIVSIQQRVARDTGCAFFNTFQAMGGSGTMARWYAAQPRLISADFIHPTPGGARLVGNLLYQTICDGFTKYKLRRMRERYARR